jgi:23S rRNA (uridine2552-2'-O)-methyltransferase
MVRSYKDSQKEYYTKKAKKDGYPARSVFKLEEFDEKYGFIKNGQKILDLGAAPGSWSLYASKKVGLKGKVIALDKDKLTIRGENLIPLQMDILESDPGVVLPYGPFQVVLSDMAPNTSGIKIVDQERSLELVTKAFDWAEDLLSPNGVFLFKIFQGGTSDEFIKEHIKPRFQKTILLKPKATRKNSKEIFVLNIGYLPKNLDVKR